MQIRSMALQGMSGHEAGRQLLAAMYREKTGKELPEILVEQRGKPYFAQKDLHFSVSHTKGHVFCVLADKPVGMDAEEMDRDIDLRLAEKILSENEKRRYEKAADKRMTLLRFWVLKEAFVKMTGDGLQGYPNHTDFDPQDSRIREMDGCLVAVIEENEDAV